MDFRPGELSVSEAAELNRLRAAVMRLENLRVAGPSMRIYRGPSNIVIESIAVAPPVFHGSGSGSGSGGSGGGDLVTIRFDALSDVEVNVTDFTVTCVDGVISANLTLETVKTYEQVSITGPDLSVSVACDTGGPC